MKGMLAAVGLVGALALTGCTTTESDTSDLSGRVPLTPAEVQSTFVNKPWRSPGGTFRFSSNSSSYTYKPRGGGKLRGPFHYDLTSNGTLQGGYTSYRFYRLSNGSYVYLHTRSGSIVPAYPS